jgi:sulfur-oxidizing protein SoxZ
MPSALINVPAKAKRGDIIEIKTLMSHIMETGYRHLASGEAVPRDIITSFTCRYNGTEIFRADLFPAIAANPFITFSPRQPRAANSNSNGSATAAFRKPRRPR